MYPSIATLFLLYVKKEKKILLRINHNSVTFMFPLNSLLYFVYPIIVFILR